MRGETQGVLLGLVGVLGFSVSLPATRLADADLDPAVVGLGRALVAALVAAVVLHLHGDRILPPRRHVRRLLLVALGVVVGFPLCTTIALDEVPASHGAVIVGLMPAATAVVAVVRGGERPSPAFWLAAGAGLLAVLGFSATRGVDGIGAADVLILLAVALGAVGYAEGGALAREVGGRRVISWALVLTVPAAVPLVVAAVVRHGLAADGRAWAGFAYVSLISMYLAFLPWYRGLAVGGVARVGQVQLVQPVLTLLWSALLVGERIAGATIAAAVVVLGCAALAQRTRVRAPVPSPAPVTR